MEREGSRSPSSTARLKGVPGVGVRVELHEGQRAVYGRRGPDLRKCYGVVAPEHYRDDAGAVYGLQPFLYALVTGLDVSRHHGHVAVVYDREVAPVSKGAPTIATSAFSRSCVLGSRMKVRTPEKRGVTNESAGS